MKVKRDPPPSRGALCRLSVAFQDFKNLSPGCWPRPPVNYCILIALALKSSLTGSLKVQQIYHFTRSGATTTPSQIRPRSTQTSLLSQGELPLLPDGSRRLEEHHQTQPVLQQQLPQNLQPAVQGRQEKVLLLAPDAGRPATAHGRDRHVTGRNLPAAGAQHVPPRWRAPEGITAVPLSVTRGRCWHLMQPLMCNKISF